jgi:hypothetical protein
LSIDGTTDDNHASTTPIFTDGFFHAPIWRCEHVQHGVQIEHTTRHAFATDWVDHAST